jgi:hypothetical protein
LVAVSQAVAKVNRSRDPSAMSATIREMSAHVSPNGRPTAPRSRGHRPPSSSGLREHQHHVTVHASQRPGPCRGARSGRVGAVTIRHCAMALQGNSVREEVPTDQESPCVADRKATRMRMRECTARISRSLPGPRPSATSEAISSREIGGALRAPPTGSKRDRTKL